MIACQLQFCNKYQLFFSWKLFWNEGQYWRLLSTFLYFGKFSLDTLFHLYFLLQYCQTLEDESFRGKRADFVYFLLFSATSITVYLIDNRY
jgi:Derlin-2/3